MRRDLTDHRPLAALRKFIGFAVTGLALCLSSMAIAEPGGPVVRTQQGPVVGVGAATYDQFFGIPFAAPPVGPLRFRPPELPASWTTPRDATQMSRRCMQNPAALPLAAVDSRSISEDCLYLNVFVPKQRTHPLPVMVEIYGGGFTIGAANDYIGDQIATKGDVIVVTLNYRLGAFGFLSLPQLAAENPRGVSGNYGFLDQQAALRWVARNIGAFGGDPGNVTIFGESAGAMSVCAHMVAPESRGLFQRAIVQSGFCGGSGARPALAMENGAKFAAKLGCDQATSMVECLRAKPAPDLVAATAALGTFGLVWDGKVLPESLAGAFQSGSFAHVPVIMGGTRDEGSIFLVLQYGPKVGSMSADEYADHLNTLYEGAGPDVLKQYPAAAYASPAQALSAVMTDSRFACATQRATRLLANQTPVYAYEFAYAGPISRSPLATVPGLNYGVAHSADVGYVYGHGEKGDQPGPDFTAEEREVSDRLIGYWTHFAATGDPNGAVANGAPLPAWPRFDPNQDDTLVVTNALTVGPIWDAHKCGFWGTTGALAAASRR